MKNPISQARRMLMELAEKPRSGKWRAVREAHLKKEPFCRWCGSVKDLQVHHIVPFHINGADELIDSNLITLCETMGIEDHLQHGHLGNWKNFNPDIRAQAKATGPKLTIHEPGMAPKYKALIILLLAFAIGTLLTLLWG